MDPMTIAVLLSSVGTMVSSWFASRQSKKNTESVNKTNLELANKEFAHNKDMWQTQNIYNSPAEQMMRLKSAGLNPNLVYSGGNVTGNAASKAPEYNAPSMQRREVYPMDLMGNLPQMLSAYNDIKVKAAQTDNIKAATDVARAQETTEALRAANIAANTDRTNFDLGLAKTLQENSIETAKANLARTLSQNELTLKELGMFPLKETEMRENIQNLRNRNELRDLGLTENDNVYGRILVKMFNNIKENKEKYRNIFIPKGDVNYPIYK